MKKINALALISSLIIGSTASAQTIGVVPLLQGAHQGTNPNNSYTQTDLILNNKVKVKKTDEKPAWYNKNAYDSLSAQYQRINRDHEFRKAYQVNSLQEEQQYVKSNSTLVGQYLNTTAKDQAKGMFGSLRDSIREDIKTSRRETRIANQDQEVKVYIVNPTKVQNLRRQQRARYAPKNQRQIVISNHVSGEVERSGGDNAVQDAMEFAFNVSKNMIEDHQKVKITSDTEARLKFDVPTTTMKMDFSSPIVEGNVSRRILTNPVPVVTNGINPNADKTNISVHRGIKPLKLNAGASYAVESKSINYGVTKEIIGPVSASAIKTSSFGDSAKNNMTYQVNLGLAF